MCVVGTIKHQKINKHDLLRVSLYTQGIYRNTNYLILTREID